MTHLTFGVQLLRYDPHENKRVGDFALSLLPEAEETINCFQALDYFQTGRAHLLLVSKTPGKAGGAVGVVTLEDVIEEILQEEVVDETDRYESNHTKRRAKRASTAEVMKGIIERNLAARQHGPYPITQTHSASTVHTTGEESWRSRLVDDRASLRSPAVGSYRSGMTERERDRSRTRSPTGERTPLVNGSYQEDGRGMLRPEGYGSGS